MVGTARAGTGAAMLIAPAMATAAARAGTAGGAAVARMIGSAGAWPDILAADILAADIQAADIQAADIQAADIQAADILAVDILAVVTPVAGIRIIKPTRGDRGEIDAPPRRGVWISPRRALSRGNGEKSVLPRPRLRSFRRHPLLRAGWRARQIPGRSRRLGAFPPRAVAGAGRGLSREARTQGRGRGAAGDHDRPRQPADPDPRPEPPRRPRLVEARQPVWFRGAAPRDGTGHRSGGPPAHRRDPRHAQSLRPSRSRHARGDPRALALPDHSAARQRHDHQPPRSPARRRGLRLGRPGHAVTRGSRGARADLSLVRALAQRPPHGALGRLCAGDARWADLPHRRHRLSRRRDLSRHPGPPWSPAPRHHPDRRLRAALVHEGPSRRARRKRARHGGLLITRWRTIGGLSSSPPRRSTIRRAGSPSPWPSGGSIPRGSSRGVQARSTTFRRRVPLGPRFPSRGEVLHRRRL